ncbi:MAG: hypothetical protein WBB45_04085 [Cyclobacteriaceae bacterium]
MANRRQSLAAPGFMMNRLAAILFSDIPFRLFFFAFYPKFYVLLLPTNPLAGGLPSMKRLFLTLFLLASFQLVMAQSLTPAGESFNERRLQITRTGMLVLGGWAIANLAGNPLLGRGATGTDKYFYQMNTYWNVVNLGLAGFGYYGAATADPGSFTLAETMREQFGIEKLLLVNAGLDVAYIAGGYYLRERGDRLDEDRWRGYGRSLILQGGFLLAFDAVLFYILNNHGKALDTIITSFRPVPGGLSFAWQF